jgi:hypothetical protein
MATKHFPNNIFVNLYYCIQLSKWTDYNIYIYRKKAAAYTAAQVKRENINLQNKPTFALRCVIITSLILFQGILLSLS